MSEKKKEEKEMTTEVGAPATDLMRLGVDDVPALLEQVTGKIRELRGAMPEEQKTKGSLDPFGPINQINTVENLIAAHSMILAKQKAYEASAAELNMDLKKYPFKISGHAASSWIADIQARINYVANKQQLDKLNKIKKKLEDNLSAEAKLARDLGDVARMLQD